ncbi:hypothetical protein LC087_01125 [Bacillus carboniphilus]|uniref:TIGR04086 family membrane protein n=1 Tax=Bacillus carboniphilus TaxID=86663 RepID=A0ABY9JZ13_9BACI|nr:hypothetical protein [Bacillus carboniphilus]WLR42871.1 hypothetical protein LC087_01125 [Bacillus carboniphilus]
MNIRKWFKILLWSGLGIGAIITAFIIYTEIDHPAVFPFLISYVLLFLIYCIVTIIISFRKIIKKGYFFKWLYQFSKYFAVFSFFIWLFNWLLNRDMTLYNLGSPLGGALGLSLWKSYDEEDSSLLKR